MVDETALQNYLLKCELQYRAEHADGVVVYADGSGLIRKEV